MTWKTFPKMAMAALLGLTSCRNAGNEQLQFFLNGEEYNTCEAVGDTLDLRTLSTEFEADFKVATSGNARDITLDGVSMKGGRGSIPVGAISKSNVLTLSWKSGDGRDTVYLRTLHSQVPDILAAGTSASAGDYYLSFVYLRLIQKYDNQGRLLFYRFEPRTIKGAGDSTGWWDFKKHTGDDGNTYYSYHEPDTAFASMQFMGFNPGKRILLDGKYQRLKEIYLQETPSGVKAGEPLDGHDFWLFNPEHYIAMSYVERPGKGEDTVMAGYIQEVENGEVTYEFLSSEISETFSMQDPVFQESMGKDYVHLNSLQVLPDGNLLCSFRHLSAVMKISRARGEKGAPLWCIQGWKMNRPEDCFHGQHYALWHQGSSTITLFNNGNGSGRTSLVRLTVNLADGTLYECTKLRDDGYYSQACGALSFSGENVIAGWGMPGNAEPSDRLVTEYDAGGKEVFSLRLPSAYTPQQKAASCTYRGVKL